ncbi:DUF2147 domain-containing protein [Sandaracinomonas limnophila]|jgi:uncharacterized protein (DUF2147 family)|uniref:DUF2147 domain-containing protein n=1 Tax=Sandaracinomonas limnophila TaxID=1862386 RepID=A0A437PTY3_9BACT|nr:DUF2147 domain-containing protein [Sandaracinomonas limnophila]RVU25722.1 DUF2147 domain-containing protein [Sandaracinomonas limnophila]
MLKYILKTICLSFISFFAFSQNHSDQILGEWLSEPKDGKILIFKQGDKYFGKISWSKRVSPKDEKNPDPALRSKELLGLVILKNFKFNGEHWESGTIYDPHSGKTYDCTLKLRNQNKTLDIRGFVGVSLFGRTSTWTRS